MAASLPVSRLFIHVVTIAGILRHLDGFPVIVSNPTDVGSTEDNYDSFASFGSRVALVVELTVSFSDAVPNNGEYAKILIKSTCASDEVVYCGFHPVVLNMRTLIIPRRRSQTYYRLRFLTTGPAIYPPASIDMDRFLLFEQRLMADRDFARIYRDWCEEIGWQERQDSLSQLISGAR